MKKMLAFLLCSFLASAGMCLSATTVQIGPSSGFEASDSDNFDPDRIAGDAVDNDTLEGSVITDASILAAKVGTVLSTGGTCVSIGDYSAAISTGAKWYTAFTVPYKHTLTKIILTTNEVVGSMTVDVWTDAAGATTGLSALTDADSLFDTATEPAIADASADNYFEVTSFDAGESTKAAGSWYVVNVDSASGLTGGSVCFEFTRTD